jgi:hypothetical protein
MSQCEGLNSIRTALAYVEQQREATTTDILLFRYCHDLAAKKRQKAQSKYPLLISSFKNLYNVKYSFCL